MPGSPLSPFAPAGPEAPEALEAPQAPETNRNHLIRASSPKPRPTIFLHDLSPPISRLHWAAVSVKIKGRNLKLGQLDSQIRTEGSELGHYRPPS